MIDTLSDASRVAMGALDADPEPASLDHVVRDTVASLGTEARERVSFDGLSRRSPDRAVGPSLLRRLVANLIGNALKYSPTAKAVEVVSRARATGPTARIVGPRPRDRDGGRELDRVFERFARTDRARQSGAAGLGLGLYACRGIVTAHGGTIVVTSDGYDLGTTVIGHAADHGSGDVRT